MHSQPAALDPSPTLKRILPKLVWFGRHLSFNVLMGLRREERRRGILL
jgi:hypothetical protein